VWDVERDHARLLAALSGRIAAGGTVYFSTNFRRFHLNEEALADYAIREISRQTIPEDFRNKRVHRCWQLLRK
jgi:23S rRNA G2069 N7-methylase RlmK/C1962 C5-methylase RlmI